MRCASAPIIARGCHRRKIRRAGAIAIALVVWIFAARTARCADATLRLRISWASAETKSEHRWQGTVSVDQGNLTQLQSLATQGDTAASVWLDNNRLEIHDRSPRNFDCLDITVTAPLEAALTIDLAEADVNPPAPINTTKITLKELLDKPFVKVIEKPTAKLLVRRAPGDLLPVEIARDHLVFSPGETLKFDVKPRLLPAAAGTSLQLRARILAGIGGTELGTQEQTIKVGAQETAPPSTSWQFNLPQKEGVYDVVIEALEPPSLRWNKPKVVAERRVQVIIVDPQPPVSASDTAWSKVVEIDPANPSWSERVRIWPFGATNTFGNADLVNWQHPILGAMAQLGAAPNPSDPRWQAYPLSISRPGAPHILEVEFPSDLPQTLGISILEPNAAGVMVPAGLDSGFYTLDDAASTSKLLRHRLIFWPRTKNPVVLLVNRRDGSRAVFSKLRVLAGPAKLPRAFGITDVPERLVAGYSARPLVPENFSAPELFDPATGRGLKDWQTFYEAYSRLIEYLNHIGMGGEMLSIMSDGSSGYPSELVQPSTRFDNGLEFETAQDPLRKDTLELALRLFDREKLRLIPAIRFTSPLPELETRIRADAQPGILLEGPQDAATYTSGNPGSPPLPLYNVLDERVQNAIVGVVHELVTRYGEHSSFGGVSIELAADSYTQLPGQLWPLDDTTIARFEREKNIKVPGEGAGRFLARAQFLARSPQGNPVNETWLKWRADQLAKFYARLRDEVTANARNPRQLYLTSTNLFDAAEAQHSLRPALPPAARLDEVLYAFGIRSDMILSDPGMVFLRPERLAPPGRLAVQGVDIEINRAAGLDAVLSKQSPVGAVFYHESQRMALPSFDAKTPFAKNSPPTALASQLSPAGRLNRQRFAHALATLDCSSLFDGGTMLPIGQEESLSDFIAAFRHLPTWKFQALPFPLSPVIARTLAANNSTYLYLVNDSDWPATVDLDLDMPSGCRMEDLSGKRRAPAPAGTRWNVSLEPYDLIAVRFSSPNVQVAGATLTPDPRLQPTLAQNVQNLRQRLAALATPQPLNVLKNPNFQLPVAAGGAVPGWSLLNPAAGQLAVQAVAANALPGKPVGDEAGHLTSNGPVTSLRSDPFPAPMTGRLSVVMWLRVDDPKKQPTLRLAVDGLHDNKLYYVSAPVGANEPLQNQLDDRWKPFLLQIDDLPAANLNNMRVRFDLMGAGSVWIDDVQLYDLYFNADPNNSEQAQLKKIVALVDFNLNNKQYGDCLHELDGYWPRFLNTYVPLPLAVANAPQPPVNNQPQLPGPAAPQQHQPKKPLDWLLRKS